MGISYSYQCGQATVDYNNNLGVNLVSDGKQLAVRWDSTAFLLSDFIITKFAVESFRQDYTLLGENRQSIKTGEKVSIHLESCGPVKQTPRHALDDVFLNANDLSVDDLLKLAYAKIESRSEEETPS